MSTRWLSRDPIRRQTDRNLYAFCENDPIDWFDYLGLHDFKLEKRPLGLRPPDSEGHGGGTWMDWGARTWVQRGKGGYVVKGNGTSIISYWWSDPTTLSHEQVQFADFESCWNSFVAEADKYIDKRACSKPTADCRKGLIDKWKSYYADLGQYLGDIYDCGDYGNRWGACDRAAKNGPDISGKYLDVMKEVQRCEKLP